MGSTRRAASWLYRNSIRRLMPVQQVCYAGIRVALDRRLGDALLAPHLRHNPPGDIAQYEQGLIAALHEFARTGDRVVIVGGGVGVTAAVAANLVGATGFVLCFEGGVEQASVARNTVRINGFGNRADVRHAVVGAAIDVYGDAGSAEVVSPADLPECDVLELDCEGSEKQILELMTIRPRVVIVESHGMFGSPSADCSEQLSDLGYTVKDFGLAEPIHAAFCEQHDIRIVAGLRPE